MEIANEMMKIALDKTETKKTFKIDYRLVEVEKCENNTAKFTHYDVINKSVVVINTNSAKIEYLSNGDLDGEIVMTGNRIMPEYVDIVEKIFDNFLIEYFNRK